VAYHMTLTDLFETQIFHFGNARMYWLRYVCMQIRKRALCVVSTCVRTDGLVKVKVTGSLVKCKSGSLAIINVVTTDY